MEIQNPEFSKQVFGWGGPKSELLKKQPSIIRAICVFDAKKVVPGMKIDELSRCQKRNKKNFWNFGFLRIAISVFDRKLADILPILAHKVTLSTSISLLTFQVSISVFD